MNRKELLKSLERITRGYEFINKEPDRYDEAYKKGIEMVIDDINNVLKKEGVYSDSKILDDIIIIKDRGYNEEIEKQELQHIWEHYEVSESKQEKYLNQYKEYKKNLSKAE